MPDVPMIALETVLGQDYVIRAGDTHAASDPLVAKHARYFIRADSTTPAMAAGVVMLARVTQRARTSSLDCARFVCGLAISSVTSATRPSEDRAHVRRRVIVWGTDMKRASYLRSQTVSTQVDRLIPPFYAPHGPFLRERNSS